MADDVEDNVVEFPIDRGSFFAQELVKLLDHPFLSDKITFIEILGGLELAKIVISNEYVAIGDEDDEYE